MPTLHHKILIKTQRDDVGIVPYEFAVGLTEIYKGVDPYKVAVNFIGIQKGVPKLTHPFAYYLLFLKF